MLPWLNSAWSLLYQRYELGNLPHAIMIEGTEGIGKSEFASHAAQTFLCKDNSQDSPCKTCASCLLFQAGSHPDFFTLNPVDNEIMIKIDPVRDLINWLHLTPAYDSYKIAIITPAHWMNPNAANSLLKTLEEPASQDLIFLLTDSPGSLPATVRSRCQRVSLNLRDRQSACEWLVAKEVDQPEAALALANDGPLLAANASKEDLIDRQRLLKAFENILLGKASVARCAESINDLPADNCLRVFAGWVADITRLRLDKAAVIRNQDLRDPLSGLVDCLSVEDWFTLFDQLLHLKRIDSASFKTQAVLEGIFADIRLKQS